MINALRSKKQVNKQKSEFGGSPRKDKNYLTIALYTLHPGLSYMILELVDYGRNFVLKRICSSCIVLFGWISLGLLGTYFLAKEPEMWPR